MDMLMRMAVTMGINCRIEGELPNDEVIQRLFVQSAAEALTNAISHAGAKTLFVRLSVDAECYTARLSNDGERPTGKIVEGGGLSSLRRKIEREGGGMTVYHDPEFVLELRLPVKRGEAV